MSGFGNISFGGIYSFPSNAVEASNGVSIESGTVVMGNAAGSNDAHLTSDRYIPMFSDDGAFGVFHVVEAGSPAPWGFIDADYDNNGVGWVLQYGAALGQMLLLHSSPTDALQITFNDVGMLIIGSTRNTAAGTAVLINTTLEHQVQVTPKAADFILSPGSNNLNVFTNEGAAGAVQFSLPLATRGYNFTFYVENANDVVIKATVGDTIRWGSSVTAAGGSISSNVVGCSITLVAINDTEWIATSIVGTWV